LLKKLSLSSRSILGRILQRLIALPRPRKRLILVTMDFVVLVALIWMIYCVRFAEFFIPNGHQALLMLAAPVIAIPIFVRLGLYRSVLRYLTERAIWTILQAVTLAVLGWVALVFLTFMTGAEGVPRSIPVAYWIGAVAFLAGSRFGLKWLLLGGVGDGYQPKRILIYGAGDAGVQLLNALRSSRGRQVLGFIGEDPTLQGMEIMGLRVYPPDAVGGLVSNMGIEEIIISTSSLNAADRKRLFARFSTLPIKLRILPPISDLAGGRYLVNFVRDFDIDDLLGRSEIPANPELLKAAINGKVVMVTGAAGSIGSAVSRLVAGFSPAALVLLDINEHGLYQIDRELSQIATFRIVSLLGSVADRTFVDRVLRENAVDAVFHCAAYKHVALVEANVLEGVRNNIFGTATLAEAAGAAGVANVVLISSDKAVRPASVMGATKRWSELVIRHYGVQTMGTGNGRCYSSVRFGNVIGSSGSVVPLFREQIANGGPVTITHENMTRYFMSVREAAELIVQASVLSRSGDILLLEMGEAVSIRDLAEDMIALAGLTVRDAANPAGDIEIVAIGARPGEKIFEELFYDRTGVTATAHPKILRARRADDVDDNIPERLARLKAALEAGDEPTVRRILFEGVEAASTESLPDRMEE
jgi:FlaA1/EpsC-like NDP-sugar epimerase